MRGAELLKIKEEIEQVEFQVGQRVRVMVAECELFTHEAEVLSISRYGEVEAKIIGGIAGVRKPEANKGEIYMFAPDDVEAIEEANLSK